MANKGLLKVSANQSFLGFTQSPQKTPKQEFSGGLFFVCAGNSEIFFQSAV